MQPSPTLPSMPSGVCSPSPKPPSWFSPMDGCTPTPPSSRKKTAFLSGSSQASLQSNVFLSQSPALPSVPSDAVSPTPDPPSQAIELLDGDSNPNISDCDKFYVVTTSWEIGICENWGIARTHVESVSNNCHKSFTAWQRAVEYYTMCFNANIIRITNPLWLASPTPIHRRTHGTAAVGNSLLTQLPTPLPSQPLASQPPQPATLTQMQPTVPGGHHGDDTQSCPITNKRKATIEDSDGVVVVVSSNSEEAVESSPVKPAVAQPSEPLAPIPANPRHHVLIIDDDGKEIVRGDGGKPVKRVCHFRMALHTILLQMQKHSSPTIPLPVQLLNVAVTPCEAGVAGPSGSVSVPIAGPSSNPPKTPERDVSDYEVSDIKPDLLMALCEGF